MAKFADRLKEARESALSDKHDSFHAALKSQNDSFNATAAQLIKLISAELEIDDKIEAEAVHKPYTHGSPENLYAVAKFDQFWFGLPVSQSPEQDTRLLGFVHCPNGHIQDFEYPTSAEDNWQKALVRLEEKMAAYKSLSGCPVCVQEFRTAREYQPKLSKS